MEASARVEGLREFKAALAELHPQWPKAMASAHKEIGDKGARHARARAASMGGVWSRAKSAIGGKGTERLAAVGVFASAVDRMAPVAFWGANKHTGWYANPRYNDSPPQHPPWVTDKWEAAVAGQGPYAINAALAAHREELLDEYLLAIDELAKKAFPQGG